MRLLKDKLNNILSNTMEISSLLKIWFYLCILSFLLLPFRNDFMIVNNDLKKLFFKSFFGFFVTLILAYLMFKLRKLDKNKVYKLLETKYKLVPIEKNLFSIAIQKWDEELKI